MVRHEKEASSLLTKSGLKYLVAVTPSNVANHMQAIA